MYDTIGVNNASDDSGCNLNGEDFTGRFTLFCFNLTPYKCNGFYFHENRNGTIDIEVLFARPLEQGITLLCYSAFEQVIAITKQRNILLN